MKDIREQFEEFYLSHSQTNEETLTKVLNRNRSSEKDIETNSFDSSYEYIYFYTDTKIMFDLYKQNLALEEVIKVLSIDR